MRIANDSSNALPYIMTRTAKGVSFVGIDGVDYLKANKQEEPTSSNYL
jgi:hypothetical protein